MRRRLRRPISRRRRGRDRAGERPDGSGDVVADAVRAEPTREAWYRSKPPDQVARDALVQAARKRRSGCSPCADAYIVLPRQNGATDADITAALNQD